MPKHRWTSRSSSGPLAGTVTGPESFHDILSRQKWGKGSFPVCPFCLLSYTFLFPPSILEEHLSPHCWFAKARGQLQAPGGTVGFLYVFDRSWHDGSNLTLCLTIRLPVKASTGERNTTELFLHVPRWLFVSFSPKDSRIRPHREETLKILPISYF